MMTPGHRKVVVDKCNRGPGSDRARTFWAGCARRSNRRRNRQRLRPPRLAPLYRYAGATPATSARRSTMARRRCARTIRREISDDRGRCRWIRLRSGGFEIRPDSFVRRDDLYRRGDRSASHRMAKAARRGARPGRRGATTGLGKTAFCYGRQQDRCAVSLSGAVPEPLSKVTVRGDCLLCNMYAIRQPVGLKRT